MILLTRSRIRIDLNVPVLIADALGANHVIFKVSAVAAVIERPFHGRVAVLLESALIILIERGEALCFALVFHHENEVILEAAADVHTNTPLDLYTFTLAYNNLKSHEKSRSSLGEGGEGGFKGNPIEREHTVESGTNF